MTRMIAYVLSFAMLGGAVGATEESTTRIFGYFDPESRIFTAAPRADGPIVVRPPKPSVSRGTLIVKADVKIVTTVAESAEIRAAGIVFANDKFYSSSVGKQKVLQRSGNSATVTITLPYVLSASSRKTTLKVRFWIASSAPGVPFVQLEKVIPWPRNGATTTVRFNASL